jgi:maleylpyruvate isomerase
MKLYGYWRSSATWRVRIGLAHKGVPYTYVPVNLLKAEQRGDEHRARSPLGQVPVLELPDGTQLTQSLAILGLLEQTHPEPALFPADPVDRARAVALAEVVNAGIQPLQNLAVLQEIEAMGGDRRGWGHDVIERGLAAYEQLAAPDAGTFSVGDAVSVADLALIPQLYNARRFGVDLDSFPTLVRVEAACNALPAFQEAHPDRQIDANP